MAEARGVRGGPGARARSHAGRSPPAHLGSGRRLGGEDADADLLAVLEYTTRALARAVRALQTARQPRPAQPQAERAAAGAPVPAASGPEAERVSKGKRRRLRRARARAAARDRDAGAATDGAARGESGGGGVSPDAPPAPSSGGPLSGGGLGEKRRFASAVAGVRAPSPERVSPVLAASAAPGATTAEPLQPLKCGDGGGGDDMETEAPDSVDDLPAAPPSQTPRPAVAQSSALFCERCGLPGCGGGRACEMMAGIQAAFGDGPRGSSRRKVGLKVGW